VGDNEIEDADQRSTAVRESLDEVAHAGYDVFDRRAVVPTRRRLELASQRPVGGMWDEDLSALLAFFAARFSFSDLPGFLAESLRGDLSDMTTLESLAAGA
jgi:hypothetical protein